jgi:hypothetical protein
MAAHIQILSLSGQANALPVDIEEVLSGPTRTAGGSGVPVQESLLSFADAVHSRDRTAIAQSRRALLDQLGAAGVIDAAGVIGIFEGVDRIADATGCVLDESYEDTARTFLGPREQRPT